MDGNRRDVEQDISIHAPPRGATWSRVFCVPIGTRISIHAPPRGATCPCFRLPPAASISIHAPPRGATQSGLSGCPVARYFNSRPSARGDAGVLAQVVNHDHDFNSRPSARGDRFRSRPSLWHHEFQFTPLREGRPTSSRRKATTTTHFNSRPSARGDQRLAKVAFGAVISIHAPPRGATKYSWSAAVLR